MYAAMLGYGTAGSTTIPGGVYVLDAGAVDNGLPDPFGTAVYAADNDLPEVRVKT